MKDINATVIVNIEPSEEDILKNLQKDARWGLNKAKNEGLTVREISSDEEWNNFYEVYKKTVIEGGINPDSLEELKKNTAVLFICEKEGKIIAGAGIFFTDMYDKEIPRLYINASLREYLNSQPNNLLYWNCLTWAKNKGYKKFDLGGWQINAQGHLVGVNKFKERWGEVVYYKKDYPFPLAIGRKLIRNVKVARWTWDRIKGRPL
ncbi:MAG: peptidoglycan bridge formation glycyltransferase FemA/FemB family protein [Candidatus Nanoarchaeia archaeon]|nr:peptidoglycan bridge formation glycyltransferase FemA/FemB family protein [Candidatus Nanoarchaeia archaeon]MDD5587595.1 peptidoglycan bridge formation glycyltransferase FemA/FemB family protein [Candidatus Nanoarchaeia archaeon]